MPARAGDIRPIVGFTGAYLLAALVAAVWTGNREFLFYIVTMAVIIAVVWVVHLRVRLTRGALAALSLWGLLHMAGGLLALPAGWPHDGPNAVLYSLWLVPERLKYDQMVHAYGFGVTTWVCWQGLRAAADVARPGLGMLVLAGAAAMGFGALNEVIEFAATLTIPHTNVGGYVNTGWDLVSNLVGVLIAMLLLGLRAGRRTARPASAGPSGPPPAAGGRSPRA